MNITHKRPADWTAEDIAAFWDWQSNRASRQQQYFTASLAPAIVRFLKQKGMLHGAVLDYGCGAGYLLQEMCKIAGVDLYGLDFSADSIQATKKRTGNNLKELVLADQLPTPFSDDQFDFICLIETIEHLQDGQLDQTMQELHRILKRKGKLFITTPFNEDLEAHLNFCPFCKTEFHHMQHMQSFNIESLTALAAKHGFVTELCVNTDIQKIKLGAGKYFIKRSLVKMAVAAGLKEHKGPATPNLIAILVKP
ncbi:MAG TPA: class I SAM-dependent methyltransferase [Ferruginibacter sp.]|nr:class I SAM-dependent methyltransferase [Ferruginibacter sp.]